MPYIYILPIETDPGPWVEELGRNIHRTYGYYSKILASDISLEKSFDIHRLQYDSSKILLQIIAAPPADAIKILGVVDVDLFIPILTFVFGEAQLKGIASVVALHRLNNKYYGLPEDNRLHTERLIKEAIHELGHNFGLIHCNNPECVMKSSTYVEDIDQKSHELCAACLAQLAAMKRFS